MLGLILLFVFLSPGVIFTIPPGPKGIFFSGETSLDAALTATVLFAAIVYHRRKIPLLRDFFGMADSVF